MVNFSLDLKGLLILFKVQDKVVLRSSTDKCPISVSFSFIFKTCSPSKTETQNNQNRRFTIDDALNNNQTRKSDQNLVKTFNKRSCVYRKSFAPYIQLIAFFYGICRKGAESD